MSGRNNRLGKSLENADTAKKPEGRDRVRHPAHDTVVTVPCKLRHKGNQTKDIMPLLQHRNQFCGGLQVSSDQCIKAVLFDFDGTLAVPVLDFALMRRRALDAFSVYAPVPAGTGRPLMEELDAVCASLEPSQAARARQAAMEAIREVEVEAAGRSSLFPFVLPMLKAMRAQGLKAAVVTRNCPEAVFRVFPDLSAHVGCVLTRDDVRHVKPHPEHIGKALSLIDCAPGESLMVGDHPMDIEAGKRAGALTAGVSTGETPAARLAEAHPDYLAHDAGALMRHLGLREM